MDHPPPLHPQGLYHKGNFTSLITIKDITSGFRPLSFRLFNRNHCFIKIGKLKQLYTSGLGSYPTIPNYITYTGFVCILKTSVCEVSENIEGSSKETPFAASK